MVAAQEQKEITLGSYGYCHPGVVYPELVEGKDIRAGIRTFKG
jgi:hypothetical protein